MIMKSFQQPDFEVIRFEYEDIMVMPSNLLDKDGNIFEVTDPYSDGDF